MVLYSLHKKTTIYYTEAMLHNIPYLTITSKTKVYGYRRRIPEGVRFLFEGKREIVKSLKTKSLTVAQIEVQRMNQWFEERVATVGYSQNVTPRVPVKLVQDIYEDMKKAGDHPDNVPNINAQTSVSDIYEFSDDFFDISVQAKHLADGNISPADYEAYLVSYQETDIGKLLQFQRNKDHLWMWLHKKYMDVDAFNASGIDPSSLDSEGYLPPQKKWDEQDPEVVRYRIMCGENLLPEPTWQNAVDDYLRQYNSSPKQRSEAQKTKHSRAVKSYCTKISAAFPHGMRTALRDIDAEDVRAFIRQDEVKPSTKTKNLTMLRAVWNSWSLYNQKQVVEGDPFRAEITLHKSAIEETEVNRRSFTPSEFRKFNHSLAEEADQEVRLVGKVAAYCGAPTGDIVKLKRKDVKLSSTTPYLVFRAVAGKDRIARSVPLLEPIRTELETYINEQQRNRPTDAIFTSKVVRSPSDLSKKLKIHITNERPDDPLSLVPYSLRHTFKDRAEAAMDSRYVQYLIGHKTKDSSEVHQKYGTGVPPSVLVDGMISIQSLKEWGMFEEFD